MSPESTRPDFAGTRRFELVRELGAGGMGVVYEAIDRDRESRVALKTLRALDAEARLRFKNEFRSLSDIQHPNLVSLGELLDEGGQLFFTMELVRGVDFIRHVRPPDDEDDDARRGRPALVEDDLVTAGPASSVLSRKQTAPRRIGRGFDEARLRDAFGQLARGLHALHAARKVHRDIKPSNVLVTASGRVVLLDFGLVTDVARGALAADTSSVVGTAHFMAPEQAAAKPVGPEADWYSMGVMLYLALTGDYPFQLAPEVALDFKQRVEPARPSLLVEGLPANLEELCVDLLRLDAAARPNGRNVLERLGVSIDEVHPPILASDFVGRRRELDVIRDALREARRGGAVTLLVEGESGVGKSALVRHFLERHAEGATVLAGRCYERESVPYKAVDELIDALARHLAALPPDAPAELIPRDMALLAEVFPVLRRITAVARAPGAEHGAIEPLELRALVFAALRELFRRLAARAPLLLVVDDLQWADADSLALLAEVIRRPGPALLLLATVRTAAAGRHNDPFSAPAPLSQRAPISVPGRSVGDGSDPAAPDVGARLSQPPGAVRRLPIRSLPPDEAEELVSALLRDAPRPGAIRAAAIAEEAGGHPLFIDALVRHRLVQGHDAGALRLDDVLWSRVERLDPEARQLLELIAVAGGRLFRETAERAAGIEAGELTRLVALLRAAHLARTSGAGRDELIEPFHDRVRETVVSHLDVVTRLAWHGRLAVAIEASGRGELEALAVHWAEAGNARRAAEYAALAGDQASSLLAFDRAARLYRTAIELAPREGAEGRGLLTRLGDALGNAGRGAEAAEAYLGAMFGAPPAEALELERRAAENLLRSGYVDEGMAGLRSVLAAVGMDIPRSRAAALAQLIARRRAIARHGLRFHERDERRIAPRVLTEIDVCWSAALGLAMVDPIRGADFQTKNLLLSLEAGEPYRVARALALEAAFLAAVGGPVHRRTARLLDEAERVVTRAGHPHALGLGLAVKGVTLFFEGRFRPSLEALDGAEVILRERCTGVPWERGSVLTFAVWNLWFLGDLRELARRTSLYLREAEERGDRYLATNLRCCFTNVYWLLLDDPGGARDETEDAIARWSKDGFHLQHFFDLLAHGQIDLYEGQGERAHRYVTERWPELEASLTLRVQVVRVAALHLRARAALAAARRAGRERAALLQLAEQSIRRVEVERGRWVTPMALLVQAGIAAVRGEAGLALALLDAAVEGFDAAEMALFATIARRRRGELRGGDEGRAEAAAANAWMREQGVLDPDRMSAMMAPGF